MVPLISNLHVTNRCLEFVNLEKADMYNAYYPVLSNKYLKKSREDIAMKERSLHTPMMVLQLLIGEVISQIKVTIRSQF